jgi:DNA-binding SARP family transcriptional activator/plasmid stability protein
MTAQRQLWPATGAPFRVPNGNGGPQQALPQLRIDLLGGFRVERAGVPQPVSCWQRRTAKTLTKLLATQPSHRLHREQVLELLWPEVGFDSALNSFAKALHAARRALEPELLPREGSAYLPLTDSMVALDTDLVWIDADRFEALAESALRQADVAGYESALAAYRGELLPEDRYEDWCAERRDHLATLHIELLLGLAESHERRGAHSASVARLREALQHDPTREDVHRRLMLLYASMGARDQAMRQFQMCEGSLKRELDLAPERSTLELYREIEADQVPRRLPTPGRDHDESERGQRIATGHSVPLVGRDSVLRRLTEELGRSDHGRGRLVLVNGEAGVGKTRLLAELAAEARRRGAAVLWGGSGGHANHLPYGPFAVALEGYVASRPDAERNDLAQRFPPLAHFVPSLGVDNGVQPPVGRPADDLYLAPAIVRLLTHLARVQPVLLALGDLHDLHPSSRNLLEYLAQLAPERRWLIVGTLREEGLEGGGELARMIDTTEREGLCLRVELQRLERGECAHLIRAMLPGGEVDDAFADHVYARSLGNPLFAEELLGEMRARGELVLTQGSWRAAASAGACVPARVRALVAQRVAPMEESVRRVLALAAANGMEISLSDLRTGGAALCPPVSDVALFHALDRALEGRILEERNDSYAFRHPLVRSALYEDLSKHRRAEIHAALDRSRAEPPVKADTRRRLQPLR